jgi:hypothetical protein
VRSSLGSSSFVDGPSSHLTTWLNAVINGVSDVSAIGACWSGRMFTLALSGTGSSMSDESGRRVVGIGIEALIGAMLIKILLGFEALDDGGRSAGQINGHGTNC